MTRHKKPQTKTTRAKKPPATNAAGPERVQKILARAGLASRREAEDWIRAGRVTVNGEAATLGTRAAGSDQLRLDGRLIHQAPARRAATWLYHRSPGENLVTPREDAPAEAEERGAMVERLSRRVGRRYIPVSPMPRIDGGLELLTSDGELAARLQRAVRGMPVEFSLRVRGELTPEQIEGVLDGQLDSGEHLQVSECEPTGGEGANRWYRVITVGANGRDLRAVVERQGATVSRVLRVALGGLTMERTLARGQVRQLTEEEIRRLLAAPSVPQRDQGQLDP
jgi:23S rRNA pseudouridine2605 synthase